MLADGRIDQAYGDNGIATTSLTRPITSSQGVCGLGTRLTVQPDGKLLLFQRGASTFGRVVRLLSDGREDPTLTHPVTEAVDAVLPDGRLVVIHCNGCAVYRAHTAIPRPGPITIPVTSIVVLRPDGSVAPDFNGGAPLMTVPFVDAVVARPDGTIDAFGDNQARIDGHGNTVLLQDIPLYDRGSYTVFPQADGGYVVQSRNRSDAVLFKVDASPQRHGASVPYQGAVMGGDVLYDLSPIISHTVFTSTGTLYDARTKRRRDEIGVAAVDRKSRLITSYGGPASPARIRVKVTRRHPRVVDVTVRTTRDDPRPGLGRAQPPVRPGAPGRAQVRHRACDHEGAARDETDGPDRALHDHVPRPHRRQHDHHGAAGHCRTDDPGPSENSSPGPGSACCSPSRWAAAPATAGCAGGRGSSARW